MSEADKTITAQPFQLEFLTSRARYPGFVAAVGTGKSMFGILKIVHFSLQYPGNLCMIARHSYTDLWKSTMKDFTQYTGLKINEDKKEVTFPNGSIIMFSHADDLSVLQNINLGAFMMEQAEEFPTEHQFDQLRFRLRRRVGDEFQITLIEYRAGRVFVTTAEPHNVWTGNVIEVRGTKAYNTRKTDFVEVESVNETQFSYPYDFGKFIPKDEHGGTVWVARNFGCVVANANGHNWIWRRWIKKPAVHYHAVQATSFDNAPNLSAASLADWKRLEVENPSKYRQYVLNIHEERNLPGAYYAVAMAKAFEEKRVHEHITPEQNAMVHTAWDIGIGDATAIWFYQVIQNEVWLIDYYEASGKDFKHYAEVLDEKRRKRRFIYGTHTGPHDLRARNLVTAHSIMEAAAELGVGFDVLEPEPIEAGIERVRAILPSCHFDESRCEDGIEAIQHYHASYSQKGETISNAPNHDWSSHAADAFRYLATAIRRGVSATRMSVEEVRRLDREYAKPRLR